MANSTTQTTIANAALQLVGYKAISLITDNDRGARAVNRTYFDTKIAELRKHFWNFAIKRASLAASVTAPIFGKSFYYPLPGDFLMLAPRDPGFNSNRSDWQIEGTQICSSETSPLEIRYISSNVTESQFDACFAQSFAAAIAVSICEELTQSNSKLQNVMKIYDATIKDAKKQNAFENRPVKPLQSEWLTKRF